MADLEDMDMAECPVCGKTCPRDFYPLCSCEADGKKAGKKKAIGKEKKPPLSNDYDG